jgi:AraC-like DNA-binding protein
MKIQAGLLFGTKLANTGATMSALRHLSPARRRKLYRQLAPECHYHAGELAERLGLCLRQLERYFRHDFGLSPQQWLCRRRMTSASRQLRKGRSVRRVSTGLGYRWLANFTYDFKRHYGVPPSRFVARKRSRF